MDITGHAVVIGGGENVPCWPRFAFESNHDRIVLRCYDEI
jgi:hypothetical protein